MYRKTLMFLVVVFCLFGHHRLFHRHACACGPAVASFAPSYSVGYAAVDPCVGASFAPAYSSFQSFQTFAAVPSYLYFAQPVAVFQDVRFRGHVRSNVQVNVDPGANVRVHTGPLGVTRVRIH